MKLIDAIKNVDRSKENTCDANSDVFCDPLNLYQPDYDWLEGFGDRVKQHYLVKWYCTDSWVGLSVYYLDDEPVATSWQSGRKADELIEFVSLEAAAKMKALMISLRKEPEHVPPVIKNLDEELGQYYQITYSSQLLVKKGFYKGQEVEVVKRYGLNYEQPSSDWQTVDVKLPNGEVKNIRMAEFDISYHVRVPNEADR